jgi:mRNA interferase RelE/StbE
LMISSQTQGAPAKPKYDLQFNVNALKEWEKLDSSIRLQFAKKLKERLEQPRVAADKLRDMPDCYKIKLRASGFRLVYEVVDEHVIITVISVGRSEKGKVNGSASSRLS